MKQFIFFIFVACSACGGNSPTTPTVPAVAQVAGVWKGTATTTSTVGGECFAATFLSTIGGSGAITFAVTQNASAVTAIVTSAGSGGTCTYAGAAGASGMLVTVQSCSASDTIGARCPNGALRDIRLVAGNATATVGGSSMTGTDTTTYNVLVSGSGTPVGSLTIINTFNATKQ